MFKAVKKYGLSILMASDEGLRTYLSTVLSQLHGEPECEMGA
jgi:hypothetical protein